MKVTSVLKRLLGPALLGLAACLPSGCLEGGTSTEAGNPGMVVAYKGSQGPVPFAGRLSIYVKDGKPGFRNPPPDGNSQALETQIGNAVQPADWIISGEGATLLCYEDLTHLINPGASFMMPKRAATLSCSSPLSTADVELPEMNIFLSGDDGSVGALQGIMYDTSGRAFRQGGARADTLWVSLAPGRDYEGAVDTAGLARPALGVFVPGLPFFAPVLGDSFEFKAMPAGDYAVRLLTSDGVVYDVVDSLHLDGDTTRAISLHHGAAVDSIALPTPIPTVQTVTAFPPGEYGFYDSVIVTLKSEPDAIIHYTADGSMPTQSSPVYGGPLTIKQASTTIRAVAYLKNHKPSVVSVNNYVLVSPPPTFSPTPGSYHGDSLRVTIGTAGAAKDAVLRYTVDGSAPNDSSAVYVGAILLSGPDTVTVRAMSTVNGLRPSRDSSATYILTP